ncbi:MAG TPA: polyprenyl synthetase family protein [Anaerohalosphaeraceae bacterium]|nr:polyprenyl synthetase family protein [Anaerohalosphaeraceae bacterium]HOL88825.1 polyprenyl synthetase family protein [Anaerohalosphaeraceae bacterium]HPP55665.1 polyprenyl synthetase family protein [Anaerohalosphaeraceae bacterium]
MPTPESSSQTAFESIEQAVQADLQRVQDTIRRTLLTDKPFLAERLKNLTENPGKMLRPRLLLLSARACGQAKPIHIDLAAIVELIHTATLLHDDVVDRAVLRRGRLSANALWGNTAAVLLGDFLLSRALALGARLRPPVISEQILQTAQQICEGELLQNYHRGDWQISEELYRQIIASKTAALFAFSCTLGAQWAEADETSVESLAKYGRYLGLAFQIRDDAMDLFSSERKTGKTVRTDLAEGKPTLPVILWLKTLSNKEKQRAVVSLGDPKKHKTIAKQIKQSPVLLHVKRRIEHLKKKACDCLKPLTDSPAKDALCRLAEEIAEDLGPLLR